MGFGWDCLRPEDESTILRGIKDGCAYGGPFHVEIDPFDLCNVSCFFCGSAHLHQGGKLGWDQLEPIVDDLIANGLRSFRMAGGGEPLIYPDLDPLCSRMASAGVVLDNLTTNGILLHKWMDTLLKCSISHVLVSLNYATPSDYAQFMQSGPEKLDTVVRNIHLLDERLVQAGLRDHTQIHTQFFIHNSTVESIPGMIELGLKLPVNSVTFKAIGEIPPKEVIAQTQIERLKELIRNIVHRMAGHRWLEMDFGLVGLQQYCEQLLREFRGWPADKVHQGQRNIEYCFMPWYSTTLQGNGDVHACCYLLGSKHVKPLGNVNHNTLREIWNGPEYKQIRWELRTAMLMEGDLGSLQTRSYRCTVPSCWKHYDCPLAYSMATNEFYELAHENMQELRGLPQTRATRFFNRTARMLKHLKPAAR